MNNNRIRPTIINRIKTMELPILIGFIGLSSYPILRHYIIPSVNWLFYLLIVVYTVSIVRKGNPSNRYGWVALLLLTGFVFLKIKVLYLTALFTTLLFLIEHNYGRINYPPVFGIILLTPFSQYFFNTFSFPIRLFQTNQAAKALSLLRPGIEANGNVLHYEGIDFTVSEVCMGLSFFHTGLLFCLFLIAVFERSRKKYMAGRQVMMWLGFTLLLVILANFLRIVTIVLFKAMPGTIGHELIGLVSFIGYIGIPVFAGLKWIASYQHPFNGTISPKPKSILPYLITIYFLFTGVFHDNFLRKPLPIKDLPQNIAGYEPQLLKNNIIQYSNDSTLVYLKPGVPFYAAEHSPRVCWRGSGYEIKREQTGTLAGKPVVFTQLKTPEGALLYSCWWFSNGIRQTTSQLTWRKAMIRGEPAFKLVNVVCTSEKQLRHEALQWIERR